MKLALNVTISAIVILLGWALWPTAESSRDLPANTVQTAAVGGPPAASSITIDTSSTAKLSPSALAQPAALCPSTEQLGSTLQQLQHQRVSLTNQLIDLHIQLGIKKPVTLHVLQSVGGDLEVFQFRQSAQKQNFPRFNHKVKIVLNDRDDVIRLQSAIAKHDYDQVLQFIAKYSIEERNQLSWNINLSTLGMIIVMNPQISFSIIQQFIDAGLTPIFADLAAFTALDLPLPLIDMVQQYFKGDLQQQWQDNFRPYNLTLLAAENASTDLFDYWRSLGIPVSILPHMPNAFDLIPLPASEPQLQQQISKVRTLLAAGVLPRAADVQSQWLLLLPEQESAQLNELLQQQPTAMVNKEGPDATQIAALEQLQTEFNQLLQQVATCPKAQRWPVAETVVRELPERFYVASLKTQQQSSAQMSTLSDEDLKSSKQMAEFLKHKNWQGLQDMLRRQQEIPAENVDLSVMIFMLMFQASEDEVKLHLSNFKELNTEQRKRISEVASPAHRKLFKAAGFELPFNPEAEKRHQQLREFKQQLKKMEQRRAEVKHS